MQIMGLNPEPITFTISSLFSKTSSNVGVNFNIFADFFFKFMFGILGSVIIAGIIMAIAQLFEIKRKPRNEHEE